VQEDLVIVFDHIEYRKGSHGFWFYWSEISNEWIRTGKTENELTRNNRKLRRKKTQ